MRLRYLPKSGALWDGCSLPPLRPLPNIYLSNRPYGGDLVESIAVGFHEYRAVFQLGAGPDALWGVS